MSALAITRDQFLELQKIGIGAFAPLTGFMTEDDFHSVVSNLRLRDGSVFSLPVYLDVSADHARWIRSASRITLSYQGKPVGEIEPLSIFRWDRKRVARRVFGVGNSEHPGVARMLAAGEWLVGGPIKLFEAGRRFLFDEELSPQETKALFSKRGWTTVAGFQTRNVPHRAHEYLQRVALELCDGLFIQPLVGRKKRGDYTPEAVLGGYKALIMNVLPPERVVLGVLSTAMRYAGPREAIFHALIRRNYGCTHFIIGRDHAGVHSFYAKYDAHALARKFADELGISILALHGPFHCRICDGIVTEKTCPHLDTRPDAVTEISGTLMRQLLSEETLPRPELMRPEVIAAIAQIPMFVEGDEA
jgi:sulfate adenylyltransferase